MGDSTSTDISKCSTAAEETLVLPPSAGTSQMGGMRPKSRSQSGIDGASSNRRPGIPLLARCGVEVVITIRFAGKTENHFEVPTVVVPPNWSPPSDDAVQRLALGFPCDGRRRITAELRRRGWEVNHQRAHRSMREDNLLCLRQGKFVRATDSPHELPVYPNWTEELALAASTSCGWRTSPRSGSKWSSSTWRCGGMPSRGR